MREVLDRLKEAETALDRQLNELFYVHCTTDRDMALKLLWRAKRNVWNAQMCVLNAAAGPGVHDPHK